MPHVKFFDSFKRACITNKKKILVRGSVKKGNILNILPLEIFRFIVNLALKQNAMRYSITKGSLKNNIIHKESNAPAIDWLLSFMSWHNVEIWKRSDQLNHIPHRYSFLNVEKALHDLKIWKTRTQRWYTSKRGISPSFNFLIYELEKKQCDGVIQRIENILGNCNTQKYFHLCNVYRRGKNNGGLLFVMGHNVKRHIIANDVVLSNFFDIFYQMKMGYEIKI